MAVRKWEFESDEERALTMARHAWKCPLCGDVRPGNAPPEECAYCLAPGYAFRQISPPVPAPHGRPVRSGEGTRLSPVLRRDESLWTSLIKYPSWSVHLKRA